MSADTKRLLPMAESPGSDLPVVFDRVAIVGLGLIGGSIALAARRTWPQSLVIGVDRTAVLEQAMVRHAIDVAAEDLMIASEADLVILAAPVNENVALLSRLPGVLEKPVVVTDVGSTKRAIVEAAKALPPHIRFVGGHPLAGAARRGLEFARADLFAGRPWLLTPAGEESREAVERLSAFAAGLGAMPRVLDPAAHDHVLAFLSHLPQLAVSSLMAVVGQAVGEEALGLAGRGLQDTTRLASSPAEIWKDICATNADEIGAALDAYLAVLTDLRAGLASGEHLERLFGEAAAWRERLSRGTES